MEHHILISGEVRLVFSLLGRTSALVLTNTLQTAFQLYHKLKSLQLIIVMIIFLGNLPPPSLTYGNPYRLLLQGGEYINFSLIYYSVKRVRVTDRNGGTAMTSKHKLHTGNSAIRTLRKYCFAQQ